MSHAAICARLVALNGTMTNSAYYQPGHHSPLPDNPWALPYCEAARWLA